MCWAWWTFSKSRQGGRISAQGESFPLRGLAPVCLANLGSVGHRHKADRPRARALRRVLLCMLLGSDFRAELADVPWPRITRNPLRQHELAMSDVLTPNDENAPPGTAGC